MGHESIRKKTGFVGQRFCLEFQIFTLVWSYVVSLNKYSNCNFRTMAFTIILQSKLRSVFLSCGEFWFLWQTVNKLKSNEKSAAEQSGTNLEPVPCVFTAGQSRKRKTITFWRQKEMISLANFALAVPLRPTR